MRALCPLRTATGPRSVVAGLVAIALPIGGGASRGIGQIAFGPGNRGVRIIADRHCDHHRCDYRNRDGCQNHLRAQ